LALERGQSGIQAGVDLQESLKPDHFQHMIHAGLRVEQLETWLEASLPVAVY
jgi:hypothetical protein